MVTQRQAAWEQTLGVGGDQCGCRAAGTARGRVRSLHLEPVVCMGWALCQLPSLPRPCSGDIIRAMVQADWPFAGAFCYSKGSDWGLLVALTSVGDKLSRIWQRMPVTYECALRCHLCGTTRILCPEPGCHVVARG